MTNFYKRIYSLFLFNTIISQSINADSNDKKNNTSDKENNNKTRVIKNTIITDEIINKLSTQKIEICVLVNCTIETNLKKLGVTFLLIDCNISDRQAIDSSYYSLKNETLSINQQIIEIDKLEKIIKYINNDLSKNNKTINKIFLKKIFISNPSIMKNLIKQLNFLYNKYSFENLKIENITSNSEGMKLIEDFILSLAGKGVVVEKTVSSTNGSYNNGEVQIGSNLISNNRNNDRNNDFPYTYEYIKQEMIKRSQILGEQIGNIMELFKDVQSEIQRGSTGQQNTNLNYKKEIIRKLLKLPTNMQNFRKFKSFDFIRGIIKILFHREFQAGAGEIYDYIDNAMMFLLEKHSTASLEHLLVVGPAGIGKTSMAKIISMIFALLVSNKNTISDELLENVSNGDELSLDTLYDKLAELSIKHLGVIQGTTVKDGHALVGVSNYFSGAKPGLLFEALEGKVFPLILLFDELDKTMPASSRQNNFEIQNGLLSLLDGQGLIDVWVDKKINLTNIWFVSTGNTTESISPLLLNRLKVLNMQGPTANEKVEIVLQKLLKLIKENKLITTLKNFSVENINGHTIYKIGGFPGDKISVKLDKKVLENIVKSTNETEGIRVPLRYISSLWQKLFVKFSQDNSNNRKVQYNIGLDNIGEFIQFEELTQDAITDHYISVVYENTEGNHVIGGIYFLGLKRNSSGHAITIPGGGTNQGKNYYVMSDLSTILTGMLSTLSSLIDDNTMSKFGLSIIKMENTNLVSIIPKNGSENTYTHSLLLPMFVSVIAYLKKLKLKKKVILVGYVTPHGQIYSDNTIKYNNIISTITNNLEFCNILILPKSIKNNRSVQKHLKNLSTTVKIIYVSNLTEALNAAIDDSYMN